MQNLLSQRIRQMAPSATLSMAARAAELKAQGLDIISLSLGEPDFDIPEFVREAAIEAIHDGYSKYSPVNGYLDLRQAICHKLERDNGLSYTPAQIVVSTGAKQCLANIAAVMLDQGDEVILPAPYWVSYRDLCLLSGGVPIEVRTSLETNYKLTPEQLEAAITPRTKMLWICSPCNPTGAVYTPSELEALAVVLRRHPQIIVVSDEIYELIRFDVPHVSMASLEGMYERTITVNGLSKAFAMTGWRLGYLAAPEWIAKACTKMQGQITSGTNDIAQRAALVALEAAPECIRYMIDEFHARRDLMLEGLSRISGLRVSKPDGAFYIFPDVSAFFGQVLDGRYIETSDDVAMYLLERAQVATVAGSAFGEPNCIRLSYAASREELTEALRRLERALTL